MKLGSILRHAATVRRQVAKDKVLQLARHRHAKANPEMLPRTGQAAMPGAPSAFWSEAVAPAVTHQAAVDEQAMMDLHAEKYVGMTGAQIVHEVLREKNVNVVFGYPGGAILPVFDAIHASPNFRFILPRHEQGGGHAAQGYARATGKVGVVIVTSGPGATNMITPLQDALMDGTPMVVLSGQVATAVIGTDAFQEADIVGITRPCTKWNTLVKRVDDLPRALHEAFAIAVSGRPGPVLVDLPKDVTAAKLSRVPDIRTHIAHRMTEKGALHRHHEGVTPKQLDRVASLINESKRPIIYAGQGVVTSDSVQLLRDFAARGNIPVTTTLLGLGAFDEMDDRSLHMLGMHGSVYANFAMQNADLILAIGARFDDRVTGNLAKFAPGAQAAAAAGKGGIIHFELSAKNINKVVAVTEPVVGDIKKNLSALLPRITYSDRFEWFNQLRIWKSEYPFAYTPAQVKHHLKPQQVVQALHRAVLKHHLEDKVVITTGVGQHQMFAAQYYRWRHPRTFITSGGAGTMGFGVPAAIGAKLGAPDKIVVDIDGDASFLMTGMELVTAAVHNIGVRILILNNHFQGMVRQWQDLFYEQRYSGTEMINPDFAKLATAMGARGISISTDRRLDEVMEDFLLTEPNKPALLDAHCEKDEHVYPMVPAGQALDACIVSRPVRETPKK